MANILVVDDRPTNRKVLTTLLGYAGHSIVEASDGAEALEKAATNRPDLIITDILMPTMDGFEFVRCLREHQSLAKTRVVFYTAAYLEGEARTLAQGCGVTDVIVKPSEPQQILSVVNATLADSHPVPLSTRIEEFDRAHLRLMTNKLAEKLEELEAANDRLENEVAERRQVELALRESQEKIERLGRIHAVLSSMNAAIVRIRDRQALFNEATRIAVQHGRFRLAWIGVADAKSNFLRPLARAGSEDGSPIRLRSSAWNDTGTTISYAALRSNQPSVCNDVEKEFPESPWKAEALKRGYGSAVALPLSVAGNPIGILELYASEPAFFNDKELDLLRDLAADISFALQYIENEEKINFLAYYDHLTRLPNRVLFYDRLKQLTNTHGHNQTKIAVVVLEMERFGVINDTFGRRAGDGLIRQIADRLKSASANRVAYTSSACFAIDLPGVKEELEVVHFLHEKIFPAMNLPFAIGGEELPVSIKAGISVYPTDGADAEAVLANAETALKRARDSEQRYLFYTPQMNARVAEKLTIENKLRRALENDEFVLYYQPKVELKSGRINGLEALIRWNDPVKGLAAPGLFIPILEESGLIINVGKWILQQAASDYNNWMAKGLKPPPVSVNVSPLQLKQNDFLITVAGAVEKCRNGSPGLDLEITENLIMANIEQSIAKLKTFKEMGVEVAIDDFGTGYSSLSYIARLPVNALKIDRSFIVDLEKNPNSMSIVSAIISLAHSLSLKVIAEGVESEQQSQLLKLLRCDEIQGHVFSPAVPPEQVEALLAS